MMVERSLWQRTRRWLGRALAVIGGIAVVSVLLLLFLMLVATRREGVPRQAILELNLEEGLVEHVPDDPLAGVLARRQTSVRDIVEALHRGAEDARVVGLVARVGSGSIGFARAEEIRDAVIAFRRSGKPALLHSETFGEFGPGTGGYYLATAFDSIFLQPSGDVGLTGLLIEQPFAAGTLERLDVDAQVSQRYEYKSAGELFSERGFTAPSREALSAVLRSIHTQLTGAIAASRGMDTVQARRVIDEGPYFGEEAVRARLVDRLAYRDEVYDSLRARVGPNADFLYASRYLQRAGRPHERGPRIALIYGVGAVVRGDSELDPFSGGSSMGAETVARAFRQAIEDDAVRAIIFRVDSPGGSYVASDAIWRETVRARAAGKPVIVTMGNYAASGGYFVAASADRIIAQPSTITGSIGVVAQRLTTREFWDERLGVTWDTVQMGGNATMWSGIHAQTPTEAARLEQNLDRIYADFTAKVAQGRNLTQAQVHQVARGRVWTGSDALRLGLVDELGGFSAALRAAREAAGLAPDASVTLRVYPERRPLLAQLLERGHDSSYPTGTEAIAERLLRATAPFARLARQLGVSRGPDVLMLPGVWEF
jgi:protease IV